jgi:hypothetical protein
MIILTQLILMEDMIMATIITLILSSPFMGLCIRRIITEIFYKNPAS